MTGDNAVRKADDIGGQELSYAEVKAIASGNPAVLTLAEADAELQRLTLLKKQHADEQYLARRNLRELPQTIDRLKQRLASLAADRATAAAHADDPLTIGGRAVSWEDAKDVLGQRLDTLPRHVAQLQRFPLGVYRGLHFGLILHPQFAPEAYLEGKATRTDTLSREHRGPRAVLNALERIADHYACGHTRQDLAIAEGRLRDYQSRLGTPFPHDVYLTELTTLRDRLKAGLSGNTQQEGEPTVAELAERIKALQAAHTVEAAPPRAGKRPAAAEEPVTTRIRRRAEASAGSDPARNLALPPAAAPPAEAPQASGPHSARVLADVTGVARTPAEDLAR